MLLAPKFHPNILVNKLEKDQNDLALKTDEGFCMRPYMGRIGINMLLGGALLGALKTF